MSMDKVKLAKLLLKINYSLTAIVLILLLFSYISRSDVSNLERSPIKTKISNEIRVLELDTGIAPHKKLQNYVQYDNSNDYEDTNGHGTHIAGIIIYGNQILNNKGEAVFNPVCRNVKIFSCKYYNSNSFGRDNYPELYSALKGLFQRKWIL